MEQGETLRQKNVLIYENLTKQEYDNNRNPVITFRGSHLLFE